MHGNQRGKYHAISPNGSRRTVRWRSSADDNQMLGGLWGGSPAHEAKTSVATEWTRSFCAGNENEFKCADARLPAPEKHKTFSGQPFEQSGILACFSGHGMSSGIFAMPAKAPMLITDMLWSAIAAPLTDTAIGPSTSPSTAKMNMSVRRAGGLFMSHMCHRYATFNSHSPESDRFKISSGRDNASGFPCYGDRGPVSVPSQLRSWQPN
jgi:hypothetical protein